MLLSPVIANYSRVAIKWMESPESVVEKHFFECDLLEEPSSWRNREKIQLLAFRYDQRSFTRVTNLGRAKATRSKDGRKFKSSGRRLHLIEFPPSSRLLLFLCLYLCESRGEAASRREEWFICQWATVQVGRKVHDGNRISADRYGVYTLRERAAHLSSLLRPPLLLPRPLSLSLSSSLISFMARSGCRVVIRMTGFHRWRRCISTVDT